MGYYVEVPGNKGKAEILVKDHGAVVISRPEAFQLATSPKYPQPRVVVVVMDNGMFEAAGIAYDVEELKAFTDLVDSRPKVILSMNQDEAWKLAGLEPGFLIKETESLDF